MSAAPSSGGVPTKQVLRAVLTSDLPKDARHIMHVLAFVADYHTSELPPQYTPSTAQIARETGQSESTVIRRRKELEAAGWIVLKRPTLEESYRRVRIRYRLAIPPVGAHRAHAEAAERFVQDLADAAEAESATDSGYLADPRTGFTVNPPEASAWIPTAVTQTPVEVSDSHPGDATGGTEPVVRVAEGYPYGWQPDTSSTYLPTYQTDQKPPAGAGDREERLKIAEDLTEAFWLAHGAKSAQRRPAVRAVIITAVADNAVPRNAVAWALDALARAGQQITPDSVTKALARLRPADDPPGPTPAPPPKPPRRFCQVFNHAHVELTTNGLCPACAGDAKAAAIDDEPAAPPGRISAPRHAMSPDDTQTIPKATP